MKYDQKEIAYEKLRQNELIMVKLPRKYLTNEQKSRQMIR